MKLGFMCGTAQRKIYGIDDYIAEVKAAEADVKSREAEHKDALSKYASSKTLFDMGAEAKEKLDEAEAARDIAAAQILVAEAHLERKRLDLGYTQVKAPMAGRVSEKYVDIGNLVGGTSETFQPFPV